MFLLSVCTFLIHSDFLLKSYYCYCYLLSSSLLLLLFLLLLLLLLLSFYVKLDNSFCYQVLVEVCEAFNHSYFHCLVKFVFVMYICLTYRKNKW